VRRDPVRAAVREALRKMGQAGAPLTAPGGASGTSVEVARIDPATQLPQIYGLLDITPVTALETDPGGFRLAP